MMNNLLLEEGSVVHVENVSLSIASFAKFQAQSTDFLDITNQKAVYSFTICYKEFIVAWFSFIVMSVILQNISI